MPLCGPDLFSPTSIFLRQCIVLDIFAIVATLYWGFWSFAWDWVGVVSNYSIGLFWTRYRVFYWLLRAGVGNWVKIRPLKHTSQNGQWWKVNYKFLKRYATHPWDERSENNYAPSLIPICLLQFMLHKRFSIWKENVKETYLSMARKRILLSNSIDGINSLERYFHGHWNS